MTRTSAAQLYLPLALLLVPGLAVAGGLEVGDTGAEAMGRGGAFVAKADSPTAVNYNPAGFVKLRGTHLAVSGNAVHTAHSFTRSGFMGGDSSSTPYPTVDNTAPWFAAPLHMMGTTDFGFFHRWTFAAGFYAPPAAGSAYPEEIKLNGKTVSAPQRYTALETSGIIMFPTAGIAFRPFDWLDIGVTFQFVVTQIKATQIGTVGMVCEQAEDPQCDVRVEIEAGNPFTPTGSAGFLLRPNNSFELGGMLRLPSKATLKGKAAITLGPSLKKLEGGLIKPLITPLDPDIQMSNDYPTMARLGARYVIRDGDEEIADIEANFIWENWSSVSKRTVTIAGQSMGKDMKPTVMDWKLNDTYALRLGGQYKLRLAPSLDVIFRAGAWGETATTDVSNHSLSVFGPKRLGIAAGLGLRWGRFRLDTSYAHVFMPKRIVNQSTITATDFSGSAAGPVVGNGEYTSSVDMFSFQLTVAFGEGYKPTRRRTRPIVPRLKDRDDDDEEDSDDPGVDLGDDEEVQKYEEIAPDPDDITASRRAARRKARLARTERRKAARPRGPLSFDPEEVQRQASRPTRTRTRDIVQPTHEDEDEVASANTVPVPVPVEDEVDELLGKKKPSRRTRRARRVVASRGADSADSPDSDDDNNLSVDDEVSQLLGGKGKRRVRKSRRGRRIRKGRGSRRYRRARLARYKRRIRRKHRRTKRTHRRSHRRTRRTSVPRNACARWGGGRCLTYKRWYLRKMKLRGITTAMLMR
jgi:long-chain fatty acid transport protein